VTSALAILMILAIKSDKLKAAENLAVLANQSTKNVPFF
jgi:hypothetical protein